MTLVSTEARLQSMLPGPERFMTMNLISPGPCTVNKGFTSYGRTVRRLPTRDNHTTADIDGAQTFVRTSTLTNRPNLFEISDIPGTTSVRLNRDTNKPDRQLLLNDIEGSQPRNKWLLRTKRLINPLEPEYILPSFNVPHPVTAKFTRDSYDVSDIEGTKSKPLYPQAQRRNHLVDDIEGTRSGWKPRHRQVRYDAAPLDHSFDVSDITGGGFQTRRMTNPLAPSYRMNGMDITDDPIKCKPRSLPKARDGPFYPLITKDIEGAQPGWRLIPQMKPPMEARRHFRNTNFMGDIPGAQADTLKRSICTNRRVNPLDPEYTSLDGELLTNPQTPLYKEPACVEAEAQLDTIIAADEAAATSTATQEARISNENQWANSSNQEESRQPEHSLENLVKPQASSEPLLSCPSGSRGRPEASNKGKKVKPMNLRRNDNSPALSSSSSLPRSGKRQWGINCDVLARQHTDQLRLLRSSSGGMLRERPPTDPLRVADQANGCSNGRGLSASSWPRFSSSRRKSRHGVYTLANRELSRSSEIRSTARLSSNQVASSVPRCVPLSRSQNASRDTEKAEGDVDRTRGTEGSAVVVRSRGEHGKQRTERLVLRSACGTPRVPLSPFERRSAQEYADEIISVHDLL